jgi:hypothetical protein
MAQDDEKAMGRMTGEQPEAEPENLGLRLLHVVLIWLMVSLGQTVLGFVTILQFVIMLANRREPNERLAEFGTSLGIWIAKAARYLTAASEVKPWPWTELD